MTTWWSSIRKTSSKKTNLTPTSYRLAIHSLQCAIILSNSTFYCISQHVLTQDSPQLLIVLVGISNFIIHPSLQSWTCHKNTCQCVLAMILRIIEHTITYPPGMVSKKPDGGTNRVQSVLHPLMFPATRQSVDVP